MSVNRIPKFLLALSAASVVIALACGGETESAKEPDDAAPAAPAAPAPVDRATLHGAPPGVELPKLIGPKQYDGQPPMLIDPSKKYTAYIEMEKGKQIILDLFADKAPKTVNNFVFLARDGFYDGLNFYQVNIMADARAGDPTGTGTGGPGYTIDDEFHPDLWHQYQMVTMDNDGGPNTSGSRFRIITLGSVWAHIETRENSATESMNGHNLDGSPRDCAVPRLNLSNEEVSCHSVFGRVTGSEASPSVSRVVMLRPRNPRNVTTPGDVIKTIRIEVSEAEAVVEQASVPYHTIEVAGRTGSIGTPIPEEPEALKDEQASAPSTEVSGEPDFKVTAVQYWFPYNKDESAADAKFRDKRILLSGQLAVFSEDSDSPYVVVRGANDKQLVKCSFGQQLPPDTESLSKAAKLKLGVKVLGLGDGKSEEYVLLRECSVVEAGIVPPDA